MDPLYDFAIWVANLGVLPDSYEARRRVSLDGIIARAELAVGRARKDGHCVQCGRAHTA